MNFRTKARGIWANFQSDCFRCGAEVTISHGKPDPHTCQAPKPLTLADLRAALERRS
jgi:hypothetical protein